MDGIGRKLLFAVAALVGAVGTAKAGGDSMPTGARTTQPVGHYQLCKQLPEECSQRTAKGAPIELSRKLWATMISINNGVNTKVKPVTDLEAYGVEEYWAYPDQGYGDCEDYALEKRRQLMKAGVPAGDLLITVARQPNGDGHAVLTVRTSMGDFVLDNLQPKVLLWSATPYTYLKRQSETNSGVWVTITDGRADAVASVR
ncbi:transglutaminase-like cysteine peptidase [Mesorhizobium retamae]|uniref:Transglutaminase-like cysteine peptidase n=1 Tax=Mesorhizobium retamae TaxID=2912854 RepID=A0ABS9QCL1_9HYPH|nr:transglutaminase-like cysteine peptidase [Mesorhizobium sp. IRAMC:0171]MCG7505158.1 transglutaminase-like cysteine peptidase [Mesorhizobium sp. IRAMC:0171]